MDDIRNMLVAAQWEKVKGELRALGAMKGATVETGDEWIEIRDNIEKVIKDFEDNSLHE